MADVVTYRHPEIDYEETVAVGSPAEDSLLSEGWEQVGEPSETPEQHSSTPVSEVPKDPSEAKEEASKDADASGKDESKGDSDKE